jgi:hypothetical protein
MLWTDLLHVTKGEPIHVIPFQSEFFSGKTADHRQPYCRLLVLVCLSAVLGVTPVFGQESAGKVASGGSQIKSWLTKIIAQSEAASARAEALLAKAKASVANSRNIHARAMSSENTEIKARASKALLNAEALQTKALADLLASRSVLAVLRGGLPEITSGKPLAFVTLSQDARYTPSNRANPAATAFYGIAPGDRLETGSVGEVRLHLLDDGLEREIQLGSYSRLVAQNDEDDDATTQLVLQQGGARITDTAQTLEAQAAADNRKSALDGLFNCLENEKKDFSACTYGYLGYWVKGRKRFEVRTPSVVCAVRGTEYVLAHDEATGVTTMKVLEGEVALLSDHHGQALLVGAGQGARADSAGLSLLETGVNVVAERRRWEE